MTKKDKILEKISKLMELSNDSGASIGEVENSMAAIKKLVIKYNLSDDDLILGQNSDFDKTDVYYKNKSGISNEWKTSLMTTIARNNMCELVYTNKIDLKINKSGRLNRFVKGRVLHVIGSDKNRKMVIDMYNLCVEKFELLSIVRYEEYIKYNISKYSDRSSIFPDGKVNKTNLNNFKLVVSRNKYINSYNIGALRGIKNKLKNSDTEDLSNGELGRYEIMVKKNNELLNEKRNELFPELRESSNRALSINSVAYNQGVKDASVSNKMLN